MDENESVTDEFEVFKDAIRTEDLELQLKMTKKLGTLAKHLGEELTRNELIPFLQENIDSHDEILLNLSEQLDQFIPLVGGHKHSQSVLNLLKKLCNTDETIIRNKAVDTMKSIARGLDSELTERLIVPIVEDLATEDWYTNKCSAVALIPAIYPRVKDEKKRDLRNSFRTLVQDESPIVRKEAAKALVDLIPVLELYDLKTEFIPVFDNISTDPMDSVKTMSMRIAMALCKKLTESEIEEFVFQTVVSCADDPSWRIRLMSAHHIGEVQENIPFGKMRGRILGTYQKLITDSQDEVRIEAVKNLTSYCNHLKKSYEMTNSENNFDCVFQQSLVPHLKRIAVDPDEDVRLCFSSNIPNISSIVGENCFKKDMMPIIEHILEQESCMRIQENILLGLHSLPSCVDLAESLMSLKIVVRQLIIDSQASWRTRRSLLVAFMHIAKTATQEYFADNLKIFYATLLGDPVFAVRKTAPVILPLLAKQYGIEWVIKHIIPYFKMFTKDCRYLYRYIPLYSINELMNPSVRQGKKEIYLADLCHLQSTSGDDEGKKKVAKVLTRIAKMIDILKNKLEENPYSLILSRGANSDDPRSDRILFYTEDCEAILKSNCDCDIYTIECLEMLDRKVYLDGLLFLIITEYLPVILDLSKDPIANVKISSIQTLNDIKEFTSTVDDELKESWVAEARAILTAEESEAIEKLVEVELQKGGEQSEDVNIDCTLMKDDTIIDGNSKYTSVDNLTMIPEIKVDIVDDILTSLEKTENVKELDENRLLEAVEKPPTDTLDACAHGIHNVSLN